MAELTMPLSLSELLIGHDTGEELTGREEISREFQVDPESWHPDSVDCLDASWVDGPSSQKYPTMLLALYRFGELPDARKKTVIGSVLAGSAKLMSSTENLSESSLSLRNSLTLLGFGLTSLTLAAELSTETTQMVISARPPSRASKAAGKGGRRPAVGQGAQLVAFWTPDTRAEVLQQMVTLLESPLLKHAWVNGLPPQEFVVSFSRTCLQLLEHQHFAKDKAAVLGPVVQVIAICARDFDESLSVTSTLMRLMNKYDHLTKLIAEVLLALKRDHRCEALVSQFVREIAKLDNEELADDLPGAKNTGQLLSELSDRLPEIILANLTGLAVHLEGDSYSVRNGVIHAFGAVLLHQTSLLKQMMGEEVDEQTLDDKDRPEKVERVISSIFQQLLAHIHDKSPFTRSRVLGCWSGLFEADAVPMRLRDSVMQLAIGRLGDKNSSVRKNAMVLMRNVICNNPFGPSLSLVHFKKKLSSVQEEEEEPSSAETSDSEPAEDTESKPATPKQEFYQAAVTFVRAVETVVVRIKTLLRSKLSTDVIQAIQLLVVCLNFQVDGSAKMTRRMLELILCRDETIRKEVVEAYRLLISPPETSAIPDQDRALVIAKSLVSLTIGASIGELTCLEALLAELVKVDSSLLSTATIQVIWDVFEANVPGVSADQRRGACQLIAMMSTFRPEMTWSRIDHFQAAAFDDREELSLFRWSCIALQKMASSKRVQRQMHLPPSDMITQSIANFFVSHDEESNDVWIPAAEQAVNTVFAVCTEPEQIVTASTNEMLSKLSAAKEHQCPKFLTRFIFFIGQAALRQLVYTEAKLVALRKTSADGSRKKSLLMGQQNTNGEDTLEEELGIKGATVERDMEAILRSVELEISSSSSMLGRFVPLAAKLASNADTPTELQTTATLTLAKFMCIEEGCCRHHLSLLFAILEKSTNASLRSNTIIALGDLCFRFPNLIEPWTGSLYARLEDDVDRVRKNALMALTHLILNGMIKVKGQVAKIALLIADKDERIAELTGVFFRELTQKNANAIYNILPDTISCLSDDCNRVSVELFKKVMSFLVSFLSKEAHLEGVTEKLCQRFKTSDKVVDSRKLAFCISLLPPTERGLRKLCENFKCYATHLADEEVADSFFEVLRKIKRTARPDQLRDLINEFESCLTSARNTSAGSSSGEPAAQLNDVIHEVGALKLDEDSRSAHIYTVSRQPASGKENQAVTPQEAKTCVGQKRKAVRPKRRLKNISSSDSDSETSSFQVDTPLGRKTTRPLRERRRVAESSSDSDSE